MKIMLACCLGMSTSVVVQKMKDAAKEQGKDYEIWAVDQNKIAENVGNFDVLLLGPQVRHLQRKVKATVGDSAPVAVIDALAYGRCNGAAILKQAEDLVNNGCVDGMSLVAEKVDENKFLGAIKDSFTIYMPFVIVGSFMNLFNTILCSTTTGLAKWVPALEALKPIFTAANFATLSCMTLPIVFLIGLKLGKKNNVPEHISAIMALASYLTICPQIVSVVVDDKTGTASGLPGAALGSQGLFVGMLVAILASQLFAFLMTFDKLKIKMPASVPTAITTSFNALIPIVLTLLGVSVGGYAFRQISGQYLTDWIYTTIQHPLENAFQSPAGLFIIILVCRAFWFLGIHGDLIIKPVRDPFLAAALAANVAAVAAGQTPSSPITYGFWVAFVVLPVSLAIFLVSKREDYRAVAKVAIGPALFGISEPMVFGLPLVLNTTMLIPSILSVMLCSGTALFASTIGFMPCNTVDVAFGTPVLLSALIGHGWQGVVVQIIGLALATLVYIPFMIVANKQAEAEQAAQN